MFVGTFVIQSLLSGWGRADTGAGRKKTDEEGEKEEIKLLYLCMLLLMRLYAGRTEQLMFSCFFFLLLLLVR